MEIIKGAKTRPFINETDDDLLVIISMKDDPKSSNLAFTEFYHRYSKFMFGMACKVAAKLPNFVEIRDAVFQNTLISIYKYCSSFDTKGETEPEIVKRKIQGWLVKITKNELLTLLRGVEHVKNPEEFNNEPFTNIENEDEDNSISYNEQIIEDSFKLLSPKEQHIFKTYWLYYEAGKGSQARNLPPDIMDDLTKQYGTTPENIRQIISRSKKKVFEYLKKNYNNNRK